mmetsp:Transcript_2093/g.6751  ORF Transcript_2093/g.6751 Transcript_2093/m.6751 type:complete len:161 (+) Transcript_2093:441-923(+)
MSSGSMKIMKACCKCTTPRGFVREPSLGTRASTSSVVRARAFSRDTCSNPQREVIGRFQYNIKTGTLVEQQQVIAIDDQAAMGAPGQQVAGSLIAWVALATAAALALVQKYDWIAYLVSMVAGFRSMTFVMDKVESKKKEREQEKRRYRNIILADQQQRD